MVSANFLSAFAPALACGASVRIHQRSILFFRRHGWRIKNWFVRFDVKNGRAIYRIQADDGDGGRVPCDDARQRNADGIAKPEGLGREH